MDAALYGAEYSPAQNLNKQTFKTIGECLQYFGTCEN
jgi:hypothetical protein